MGRKAIYELGETSHGGIIHLPAGHFPVGRRGSQYDGGIRIGLPDHEGALKGKTIVIAGNGSDRTKLSFPFLFADAYSNGHDGGAAIDFTSGTVEERHANRGDVVPLIEDVG